MEFFTSTSPAVTLVNMRYATHCAMQHLRALRTVTDPENRAFHKRKLAMLEQAMQSLETDFCMGAMPSEVWFDLPPNEWWDAN